MLGVLSPGPPSAPPTDLPQQLGHDLDLLATAEQVAEGHASDPRHLHGVHQHHEPLQQPQGQEGVLEAVHSQPAARLVIPVLGTRTAGVRVRQRARVWVRSGRGEVRELTGSEGGGRRLKGKCGLEGRAGERNKGRSARGHVSGQEWGVTPAG